MYSPSNNRRRFLIFDVETTGLLPKVSKDPSVPNPSILEYPHILQLSFVIYDLFNRKIIKSFNSYVKIPTDIVISDYITNLTEITHEMCDSKGRPIIDILKILYNAYMVSDCIIAHNANFDINMIKVELERNRLDILTHAPQCLTLFDSTYEKINGIERYCTMLKGTNLCRIMVPSKIENKPPTKKWPKLVELYKTLFANEDPPANLHNSMIDVLVCMRCYLNMRHNIVIDSSEFANWIKTSGLA